MYRRQIIARNRPYFENHRQNFGRIDFQDRLPGGFAHSYGPLVVCNVFLTTVRGLFSIRLSVRGEDRVVGIWPEGRGSRCKIIGREASENGSLSKKFSPVLEKLRL